MELVKIILNTKDLQKAINSVYGYSISNLNENEVIFTCFAKDAERLISNL